MLIKTDRGDLGELAHSGMGYGMEKVSPDDIKIQAEYKWLGSVRIISETRLMENAMNFLAILSKVPLDTVDIDLVRILIALGSYLLCGSLSIIISSLTLKIWSS